MKLIDRLNARVVGLTLLAGTWSVACGNSDTPNDGFADLTTGGTSAANTITGGTGTGGVRVTGGAPPAAGGTATTGGTKNATGGSSASAGGTSATTGGTSTTSAATGGASTATGGASTPSGGTSTDVGGTSNTNGGTTATTGGTSSSAGGTTVATGGTSAVAGGTSTIGGTSAATGGSVATGGVSAAGGTDANGGVPGTGGSSSTSCPIVYDFETDVQGWTGDTGLTLATSTTNVVTGNQALKVTTGAIAVGAKISLTVNPTTAANLWPGTVLTFHAMVPTGVTNVWMQAFSQYNNWAGFDTAGNSAIALNPGGWTTWTYTIPDTLPGGIQALGIQIGVNTGGSFAAGDIYIDSITACGGSAVCSGNGTGSYGWDTAGSVDGWSIDGNSSPADTAIAQSTTMPNSGAGSLQISFTSLPASASRHIILNSPNAYCGQVITYKVYVPADFGAGIALQPFAVANGYVWDTGNSVTPTPGAWNTLTYTLPQIGPLGLQSLGFQIYSSSTATPYTGSIYLDDVAWGGATVN